MTTRQTTETQLWRWLSGARLSLAGHRLHLVRMENAIGSGQPDVNGCLDGVDFWIELKCCSLPKRDGLVRPRFRPTQLPWIRRRHAAGSRVAVLLQIGAGSDGERYIYRNDALPALNDGVDIASARYMAVNSNAPFRQCAEPLRLIAGMSWFPKRHVLTA